MLEMCDRIDMQIGLKEYLSASSGSTQFDLSESIEHPRGKKSYCNSGQRWRISEKSSIFTMTPSPWHTMTPLFDGEIAELLHLSPFLFMFNHVWPCLILIFSGENPSGPPLRWSLVSWHCSRSARRKFTSTPFSLKSSTFWKGNGRWRAGNGCGPQKWRFTAIKWACGLRTKSGV